MIVLVMLGAVYAFGALQAFMVGVMLAWQFSLPASRRGPGPAIIAGFVACCLFMVVAYRPLKRGGVWVWPDDMLLMFGPWVVIHLGAALACWTLCRALFDDCAAGDRAPQSGEPPC